MPSEADTCRKSVVPLLQTAGWDTDPHSIAEQRTITDGRIVPVGNAALAGARMALFGLGHESDIRMEHIRLHTDPKFEECYIHAMALEATLFPQS